MKISDRAWWFAINECLSDYDHEASALDVLAAIENEDDSIIVWEPFEDYSGQWVAETITGLARQAQSLLDSFAPLIASTVALVNVCAVSDTYDVNYEGVEHSILEQTARALILTEAFDKTRLSDSAIAYVEEI